MKQNSNKNFPQQTHFLGVLIPEDLTLTLEDGKLPGVESFNERYYGIGLYSCN